MSDAPRVLVVSADRELRDTITAAVRSHDCEADAADGADAALALLASAEYQIALLDIGAWVDGELRLLDAIESDIDPIPAVVVLVPLPGDALTRLGGRRIHAIVRKPFNSADLAAVVAAAARRMGDR